MEIGGAQIIEFDTRRQKVILYRLLGRKAGLVAADSDLHSCFLPI